MSWESRGRVLAHVDRERIRQEELKASGRFAYTCADAECTNGSPVKDFYDVEDLCLELAVAFLDLHESRRNKYGESL